MKINDNQVTNNSEYLNGAFKVKDLKIDLDGKNDFSLKVVCSEYMKKTEKHLLKIALEKTNWNRKKAAELLDISYKSLLNKIKAYDLA